MSEREKKKGRKEERKKGRKGREIRRKGRSRRGEEETGRAFTAQNNFRLFHNFLFYQDLSMCVNVFVCICVYLYMSLCACVFVCMCVWVGGWVSEREQGTERFYIYRSEQLVIIL